MNCLKSSPNFITSARCAAFSFGQTGPACSCADAPDARATTRREAVSVERAVMRTCVPS
ncbi:MAG: hypothetical protein QM736_23575 [Vicinamibacterales bacterium]